MTTESAGHRIDLDNVSQEFHARGTTSGFMTAVVVPKKRESE